MKSMLDSQFYYDVASGGFITKEIHGKIPDDAIPVEPDEHMYLIDQVNNHNKEIVVNDGKLTLQEVVLSDSEAASHVRQERDNLLRNCDWSQLPDVKESTRTLYQSYRQDLRDIPSQEGFPHDIVWPKLSRKGDR